MYVMGTAVALPLALFHTPSGPTHAVDGLLIVASLIQLPHSGVGYTFV